MTDRLRKECAIAVCCLLSGLALFALIELTNVLTWSEYTPCVGPSTFNDRIFDVRYDVYHYGLGWAIFLGPYLLLMTLRLMRTAWRLSR